MSDTITKIENLDDKLEAQDDILKELNLDKSEEKLESSQLMKNKKSSQILIALSIFAIMAGIGTGFGVHKLTANGQPVSTGPANSDLQQVAGEVVQAGDIFGIKDEDTFTDSAEGYLVIADIDDEGSHKLLRPGGDSQTVYLTSSSTDLDKFEGMEIKIKGETFKGQKAGWLMDVGQVEVLVVKGEEPSEF
ncbi:MAG: hypothetical protein GW941_02340 [Candidatus Pacebacteria bacterium]|nr:hypothetical protein [Candidatus Paceibacterota bacterium]